MSDTLTTLKGEAAAHQARPFAGSSMICEVKLCQCRSGQETENGWYPLLSEMCDANLRNIAQACLCLTVDRGLYLSGQPNGVWQSLPGMQGMFDFVNYNIHVAHRRCVEDYLDAFMTDIIKKNDIRTKLWLDGLFIAAVHSPLLGPPMKNGAVKKRAKLE